jgi:hypothetical protein
MNQFGLKLKFTEFYSLFEDLSFLWPGNINIEFISFERVEWIDIGSDNCLALAVTVTNRICWEETE